MKTEMTYKELKETIAKANDLISGITFNELASTMLKDHNLESMILAKRSYGIYDEYLTLRVFANGHLKFAFETVNGYADDFVISDNNLIYFASIVNDTTDTVNLLVNEYLNGSTVKYVISWTLSEIYAKDEARPYFKKGITSFDELISALKRTKLISLTKIKNTDNYKLKIKPTNTEYVLKYFVNRKDYDEFYFNQVFGGDSRAETIEKLLVEKYTEAKVIHDTILNDLDTVYQTMIDKVGNGIRELAVRDSFINYINNIDNPVSHYMEFKDGSWSILDKKQIDGWVNYGETVKPTYVEYNHRTNEILGIYNIVPTDLPTLIKLYSQN